MKVLVTGGVGFIGSHLCERLLSAGHQVWIVDDLNDFYSPTLKYENLAAIRDVGEVAFHQVDICDEPAMASVFALAGRFDAIFHLAARAGVRPSLLDPLLYEQVNVRGTMLLMELARRFGVGKFILASSSSVYGASNKVPFAEDDQTARPISPYAATKIAAEGIGYTYSHLYGISVTCLRFFTVYGPRQRPDLAIRKFLKMIDEGSPIPIYGDGSTARDYTFITDIVKGVESALRHEEPYSIFNLGNSSPVALSDLIATLEASLGKTARIERFPDQPGDVPITYADTAKAKKRLGFSPMVSFNEGIRIFTDWYLSRKRAGLE